jgi:hypothetical protein
LTTNFKPKNDDSKKITIQDGYQIYCPNSSETNRRVQIKSCEIDLNLKKEVVRPASAKIESRSRTPGTIINGIQRNELPQKVSPSRIIHPTNQTKHYIPSTNNIRLKSSPSTGSLANNKIVVPSTPQKKYYFIILVIRLVSLVIKKLVQIRPDQLVKSFLQILHLVLFKSLF